MAQGRAGQDRPGHDRGMEHATTRQGGFVIGAFEIQNVGFRSGVGERGVIYGQ